MMWRSFAAVSSASLLLLFPQMPACVLEWLVEGAQVLTPLFAAFT